jgi:hypothetical protein
MISRARRNSQTAITLVYALLESPGAWAPGWAVWNSSGPITPVTSYRPVVGFCSARSAKNRAISTISSAP